MRALLIVSADAESVGAGHLDRLHASTVNHEHGCHLVAVLRDATWHPSVAGEVSVVPTGSAGSSRARNIGLAYARDNGLLGQSDVVGFPDDDCWYPPGLLDHVFDTLSAPDIDFTFGCYAPSRDALNTNRWPPSAAPATPHAVFGMMSGVSMFFTASALEELGFFDERFGFGTRFGCAEDVELGARALSLGMRGVYRPEICVGHVYKTGNRARYIPGSMACIVSYVGRVPGCSRYAVSVFRWVVSLAWRRELAPRALLRALGYGARVASLRALGRW